MPQRCLSVSQGVSWCLRVSRGLSQGVSDCLRLSQGASDCLKVPQTVSRCLRLSQTVSDCLRLSRVASSYIDKIVSDAQARRKNPPTMQASGIIESLTTTTTTNKTTERGTLDITKVPIQGRWIGTDNVTFTKHHFDQAFQGRLDRKNPISPSISKVDMIDGFVLDKLQLKAERLCVIEFESGRDAAIALSIKHIHVIVSDGLGMKKLYRVSLSIPGQGLTMQSVYSVIWENLVRLDAIAHELKRVGAIRLSDLKEPNLSSDTTLRDWYRSELTRVGIVLRLGGVCSMVERKFLIVSDRANIDSLKDLVLRLHMEERLIVDILRQYQANGIVFEFQVAYEI